MAFAPSQGIIWPRKKGRVILLATIASKGAYDLAIGVLLLLIDKWLEKHLN